MRSDSPSSASPAFCLADRMAASADSAAWFATSCPLDEPTDDGVFISNLLCVAAHGREHLGWRLASSTISGNRRAAVSDTILLPGRTQPTALFSAWGRSSARQLP